MSLDLNSIAAHNLSKLTLLEAYNIRHISLRHLNSTIQHDDERLHLSEYKLPRANNPQNNKPKTNKRGRVGVYFKEFLLTNYTSCGIE